MVINTASSHLSDYVMRQSDLHTFSQSGKLHRSTENGNKLQGIYYNITFRCLRGANFDHLKHQVRLLPCLKFHYLTSIERQWRKLRSGDT